MPNESVGTAAIELKHVANGERQEIEFIDQETRKKVTRETKVYN